MHGLTYLYSTGILAIGGHFSRWFWLLQPFDCLGASVPISSQAAPRCLIGVYLEAVVIVGTADGAEDRLNIRNRSSMARYFLGTS